MEFVIILIVVALLAGVVIGRLGGRRRDRPDDDADDVRVELWDEDDDWDDDEAPDTSSRSKVGPAWEPADDQTFRIAYLDSAGERTERSITVRAWRRDEMGRVRLGATCHLRGGWRVFAAERIVACYEPDGARRDPRGFLMGTLDVDIGPPERSRRTSHEVDRGGNSGGERRAGGVRHPADAGGGLCPDRRGGAP